MFAINIKNSSPCINSGSPNSTDSNGTISDIGAIPFSENCSINGDLNFDYIINVMDVVVLINCILFNSGCTVCFDTNNDNQYNVLDVLGIVNLIID